jgi:hypothetical protein
MRGNLQQKLTIEKCSRQIAEGMGMKTDELDRELDIKVAELVMGWKNIKPSNKKDVFGVWDFEGIPPGAPDEEQLLTCLPSYSLLIEHAFDVAEQVGAYYLTHGDDYGYIFTIHHGEEDEVGAEAKTPALAICKAAVAWKRAHGSHTYPSVLSQSSSSK